MGWRKCFCKRAHSERHEATDGEVQRPREASSNDTSEREVAEGEALRPQNM